MSKEITITEDGQVEEEAFCDCCGQRCDNYFDGQKMITYEEIDGKILCSECLNDNVNSL